MITVLFFGPLAELTGCDRLQMEVCTDTDHLQQVLSNRYPALRGRKFALAVNQAVVQQKTLLVTGSEVALLPPFSGG